MHCNIESITEDADLLRRMVDDDCTTGLVMVMIIIVFVLIYKQKTWSSSLFLAEGSEVGASTCSI